MVPPQVIGFLCGPTDCQVGEVRFYNLLKELAIPLGDHPHLPEDSEVSARPLKWTPCWTGLERHQETVPCAPITATDRSSSLSPICSPCGGKGRLWMGCAPI